MSNIEFIESKLKENYPHDYQNILFGLYSKKQVTFRVNTLKSTIDSVMQELNSIGLMVEKVGFSEVALILKEGSELDLQNLSIYKEGHIYLQSLSSMLPPIVLNALKGDVLDMAAAPGGKTTQMAALAQNQIQIMACEQNPIRAQKLEFNLKRQGANKVNVVVKDARQLDDFYRFDHILLDAPCSGSGTLDLNRLDSYKTFTPQLIEKSIQTQKALILKAIQLLKPNQTMVYSTCSLLKSENEAIVKYALATKQVEIIPIELKDIETLPSNLKGVVTVMPSALYEGFFIALLRKVPHAKTKL